MKVYYQNRVIGDIGKYGSNNYIFTIKTDKMHRTIEFKAKNINDAEKKAQKYLNQLINKNVGRSIAG